VSIKLIPASTAIFINSFAASCGREPIAVHVPRPPKVIVPKHNSDTFKPVLPNNLYFIFLDSLNFYLSVQLKTIKKSYCSLDLNKKLDLRKIAL
jgi:hypothetical protein